MAQSDQGTHQGTGLPDLGTQTDFYGPGVWSAFAQAGELSHSPTQPESLTITPRNLCSSAILNQSPTGRADSLQSKASGSVQVGNLGHKSA